jgi:ribose transport system permease protein
MTETATKPAPPERKSRSIVSAVGNLGERAALPALLVIMILFFSLHPTTGAIFTSSANIQNITANQSVTGLIALGMVIPLVAGYFDLSVAAIAGLSTVTVVALVGTHGLPVAVGLAGGLAVGLAAGAVNGILVGGLRLNPFITTFAMYVIVGGLLQLYTKGHILTGMPAGLGTWAAGKWLGIARPFWLLMAIAALAWYLLSETPFGRKLAAIGSNETAARLAGIRVDRAVASVFLLSGLAAGLAGALLAVRTGSADQGTALSFLFPALAAVFLGQTSINPGHYNVWGTVIGVFLVAVAVNGLTLLGADAWITAVFNGGALLLSVTVSSFMARARERRARAIVTDAAGRDPAAAAT